MNNRRVNYEKKRKGFILPFVCLLMAFICTVFSSDNYYINFMDIYISDSMFVLIYAVLCSVFIVVTSDKSFTELDDLFRGIIIIEFLPAFKFCINCSWLVPAICFLGFELYSIIFDKILSNNGLSRKRITALEKRKVKSVACRITCMIMSVVLFIMIILGLCCGMYSESFSNIASSFSINLESTDSLEENPDELKIDKQLAEKMTNWKKLSDKEKIEIHKEILDMECKHLEISGIEITYDEVEYPTVAYYRNSKKKIVVGYDSLSDNLFENINTICHECFHAYEYYTVEHADYCSYEVKNGFYYRQLRLWKNNIENYTSAEEDYTQYRKQPLEADAYSYGEERENTYRNAISLALNS